MFLVADPDLNTLVDFRFTRTFKAGRGENGGGANRTGAAGGDLDVPVPVGTTAIDSTLLTVVGQP